MPSLAKKNRDRVWLPRGGAYDRVGKDCYTLEKSAPLSRKTGTEKCKLPQMGETCILVGDQRKLREDENIFEKKHWKKLSLVKS